MDRHDNYTWIEQRPRKNNSVLEDYELVLDGDKTIFLFGVQINLTPQQYKFLKNILVRKKITSKALMDKVKTKKLKADKTMLSYRISNKIKSKIIYSFIMKERISTEQESKLKDDLQLIEPKINKKKYIKTKNKLEQIKKDWFSENKNKRIFQINYPPDSKWANIEDMPNNQFKNKQNINIEEFIANIFKVSNGVYSTSFENGNK